jgi:hypothetical protein
MIMASVTSTPPQNSPIRTKISKRRIAAYAAAAAIILGLIWFAFNFGGIKSQARLGASYAAHVACSCRYIEGRDLNSCRSDFEPGMELVSVADDPTRKRIIATVPLLAKAVAERRGASGCQQLNDAEMNAAQ